VRPLLEPHTKFGETTKPPTSSMTYGWRVDGGAPRAWSHLVW
jgi:hypothetical protein